MNIIITCLFGLESLVREDLLSIGYERESINVSDGVVTLRVNDNDLSKAIARVNIWVRRGERVYFEVGSFEAHTFDEYFDNVSLINWIDYIPKGYAIIINGFSRKSKLFGISALQKLGKKAIIKSLLKSKQIKDNGLISEDRTLGEVNVEFSIVNNYVRIMIETSGSGLHKRGYRPLTHDAPIKETLASGMVSLAHYKPFGFEALVDPFCGSGTILIEAALMALNIAPGINRNFAFETLPYIDKMALREARIEALDLEKQISTDNLFFFGSDIDKKAILNAKNNAELAGVAEYIDFSVQDYRDNTPESIMQKTRLDRFLIVTNPPYGGRLLTPEEADSIYRGIASTYLLEDGTCKKGARLSVITPDDTFFEATRMKADKRHKLYNGNIKCQLNNYFRYNKS